MSQPSDSAGL